LAIILTPRWSKAVWAFAVTTNGRDMRARKDVKIGISERAESITVEAAARAHYWLVGQGEGYNGGWRLTARIRSVRYLLKTQRDTAAKAIRNDLLRLWRKVTWA
jgi:hypothetical protein